MKSNLEILKEATKENMIQFNIDNFERDYPSLLKSILKAMEAARNESINNCQVTKSSDSNI